MKRLFRKIWNQKGQAAVLLAAALPFLLGFMTLSLDAGRVFVAHEKLQSAADAAALAGASYLPGDTSQAISAAVATAVANGVPKADVAAEIIGSSGNQISVSTTNTLSLFFGPLIGIPSATTGAVSVAEAGLPESMSGLIPLGVVQGNYTVGQTYTLKTSSGSGTDGDFGPLWFGDASPGASTYEKDLRDGAPVIISVGETIETEPGNMVGPTDSGLQGRISDAGGSESGGCQNFNGAGGTAGDVTSPLLVYVPIITPPAQGRTSVTVVGFAAFWLEKVSGGEVTGEFLKESVTGPVTTASAIGSDNVVGVQLIR